jgi:hypothetical protein
LRVGSAIRDRAIGRGPWSLDYVQSGGIPRRRLLWLAAIPVVAFVAAFGVGAATRTHTARPLRLAPASSVGQTSVRLTDVSPAGRVPALKVKRIKRTHSVAAGVNVPAAPTPAAPVPAAPTPAAPIPAAPTPAGPVPAAPVVSHPPSTVSQSVPATARPAPTAVQPSPAPAEPSPPPPQPSPSPTSGTGTTSGGG